jgi:FHS family Na+ dependent glucose MFS transporter 1
VTETITQSVEPVTGLGPLPGYYGAIAGIGLMAAVLGPTLPGLAEQTGSSLSQISALFVAKSVGYLSGSVVAGRLYDRAPGHPILALAVVVSAVSLAAVPLAPWLWLLVAVSAVLGAAEAAIDVGGNTLVVWTYGDRVGPYMNGLHFAFGLGAFLAPLIVAQAMAWSGGIAWAYWALAILVLPPVLWLARRRSPAIRGGTGAAQAGPIRYGIIALVVICFFFYVGSEVGFGAWVYTYATRLGLADEASAAYLTAAFWGALTAGRLLSIPLALRFRPRAILAVDLAGCLLSVGLVLVWPASSLALWAGAIGAGLFMASIFPTLMSFASRRIPMTGQIASLFFIGSSLGGTALPWLIGQLFEPAGPGSAMQIIFAGVALDAVAFTALLVFAPQPASSATPA